MDAGGICGSDVHDSIGANGRSVALIVMGREAAGFGVSIEHGHRGFGVGARSMHRFPKLPEAKKNASTNPEVVLHIALRVGQLCSYIGCVQGANGNAPSDSHVHADAGIDGQTAC